MTPLRAGGLLLLALGVGCPTDEPGDETPTDDDDVVDDDDDVDDDDATDDDDAAGFTWHEDADGDGFGAAEVAATTEGDVAPEGLIADGTDCDDADPHLYPQPEYTSGLQRTCAAAVYPGTQDTWHEGRVEQPFHFVDSAGGGACHLYFRAHSVVERHAIGVVLDPECDGTFEAVEEAPILAARSIADWDGRNVSNPAVVHVPTFARPYFLFFHARDGSNRKVGLATAVDPLGPFERLDGDGDPLLTPVLDLGPEPTDIDSRQVHHPTAHFDGDLIRLWYTARELESGDFTTAYATSPDGLTWTKDEDAVLETEAGAFDSDRVTQPGVLANTFDPDGGYDWQHWWTGDRVVTQETVRALGVGHGSETSIERCALNPVLEIASYPAVGSASLAGQGLHYQPAQSGDVVDFGTLRVYYGGTVQLDEDTYAGDAAYDNQTGVAGYILRADNAAPLVAVDVDDGDTLSGPITIAGTITDHAPDTVLIGVEFVAPGASSADAWRLADVAPTGNTDTAVQATTWSAADLTPPAGTYDLLVRAEDEGCARRTVRVEGVVVE